MAGEDRVFVMVGEVLGVFEYDPKACEVKELKRI